MKYHAPSEASDPGHVELDLVKLCAFHPELDPNPKGFLRKLRRMRGQERETAIELLAEHMEHGDSRAAVVMEVDPLMVAAYTDELDCVVLLLFLDGGISGYPRNLSSYLCQEFDLRKGSRLLTVNTYQLEGELANDLVPGADNLGNYCNFWPVIADFVSNSHARIEERKREISDEEWLRTEQMGRERMAKPYRVRDGRPFFSTGETSWEAEPMEESSH
jgi:hypothetical protein